MWNLNWCLLLNALLVASQDEIVVQTKLGEIKGKKRLLVDSNRPIFDFLKLPFAKAPIGDLRFKKPRPYGTWSGILDATSHGPSCFQRLGRREQDLLPNTNVSEDCLHLNIHVPTDISVNNNKSVMIWIHGGGYLTGQASYYDGLSLAITGDIIVVVIQYRLGIFGFFSKDNLKGNYGLWDQIMAFKWVKDNIASFGGDSESITIFGESAGAFCVGIQSTIPQNHGLFKRAILQSGTGIASSTVATQNSASLAVANNLNCTQSDASLLLRCLQKFTADVLLTESLKFFSPASWSPKVDGDLLKDLPINRLSNKASEEYRFYRSLDIVVGTVSGESSLLLNVLGFRMNLSVGIPTRYLCNVMAPDMAVKLYKNNSKISDAICNYYMNRTDYIAQSHNIMNAYADFNFHVPALESLDIHSEENINGGNHYQFFFSRNTPIPIRGPYPSWFEEAEHQSDVVFQFPIFDLGQEDTGLAIDFMKYWTHFAKTGNMNVTGLPRWREYDSVHRHYIQFDVPITTGQHLFKERADFWLIDIPAMLTGPTASGFSIISNSSKYFLWFGLVSYTYIFSFL